MAGARERPRAPTDDPKVDLQDLPVEALLHVGSHAGTVLRARGYATAGDVLSLLPRRYLDLREADDWRRVRHGAPGTLVSVEGRVDAVSWAGSPRARRLMVAMSEPRGTTVLRLVFFHARQGQGARFAVGSMVRVVGALRAGPTGPELVQPKVLGALSRTKPIEPVYGGVGSVAPGNVARIVASAVARAREWSDPVPVAVAKRLALPPPAEALRALHAPDAKCTPAMLQLLVAGRSPAHRRMAFEELLALGVALERARRQSGGATPFVSDDDTLVRIERRLAITLTDGQREAIATLREDLATTRPMRRLLVGDVGSGKTAVAIGATLTALRAGGSVAWLCPTTLVAEQHAKTLERALAADGGPLAVLLGSTAAKARRQAERVIAEGLVRIVVGTHTLLESGSTPPNLGLVVVDEQHRFGVAQRLAMVAGRSPSPHLLVMSATPIPRTLALAQYGDLDVVTLRERPAGRQVVTTRVVAPDDRSFVTRTIERALEHGGRAFVVVPRIDAPDDDDEGPRTHVAEVDAWLGEALGRDRIATVHGRMSVDDQREALEAFRRGTHPILLGTTVVEVGLDVPAANLMVILGAEHFGMAQLHQLRGRVGRAGQKAACLLVAEGEDPEALARLNEVASCHDGFALAERDLERRGGGEWFGARQHGADTTLRFADPMRDPDLVAEARAAAVTLVDEDPTLAAHGSLARAVRRLLARGASPVGEEAG